MRAQFILSALAVSLAACSNPGPITGGPCRYEESIITGTARTIEDDGVMFDGPEGEFWVSSDYLAAPPAPGETVTFKRERIIEGTCTPEIYSIVTPAEEG